MGGEDVGNASYALNTGRSLHYQVENHVQTKKNLLFLSCINKMGQTFIKKIYEYIYMVSIT